MSIHISLLKSHSGGTLQTPSLTGCRVISDPVDWYIFIQKCRAKSFELCLGMEIDALFTAVTLFPETPNTKQIFMGKFESGG